jgi:hypothetical protein
VYDFKSAHNPFVFDNQLNGRLFEMIRAHNPDKPTLIFVSTRKGTLQAARAIVADMQKNNLPFDMDRKQQNKSVTCFVQTGYSCCFGSSKD